MLENATPKMGYSCPRKVTGTVQHHTMATHRRNNNCTPRCCSISPDANPGSVHAPPACNHLHHYRLDIQEIRACHMLNYVEAGRWDAEAASFLRLLARARASACFWRPSWTTFTSSPLRWTTFTSSPLRRAPAANWMLSQPPSSARPGSLQTLARRACTMPVAALRRRA